MARAALHCKCKSLWQCCYALNFFLNFIFQFFNFFRLFYHYSIIYFFCLFFNELFLNLFVHLFIYLFITLNYCSNGPPYTYFVEYFERLSLDQCNFTMENYYPHSRTSVFFYAGITKSVQPANLVVKSVVKFLEKKMFKKGRSETLLKNDFIY